MKFTPSKSQEAGTARVAAGCLRAALSDGVTLITSPELHTTARDASLESHTDREARPMNREDLIARILADAGQIADTILEAAACEFGPDSEYSTDTMVACMVSLANLAR